MYSNTSPSAIRQYSLLELTTFFTLSGDKTLSLSDHSGSALGASPSCHLIAAGFVLIVIIASQRAGAALR